MQMTGGMRRALSEDELGPGKTMMTHANGD
jgi:hypothetical protein